MPGGKKIKREFRENLGTKKRDWADTISNNVNDLKQDVDKFMNKNTCKEYMMTYKKSQKVTRTKNN